MEIHRFHTNNNEKAIVRTRKYRIHPQGAQDRHRSHRKKGTYTNIVAVGIGRYVLLHQFPLAENDRSVSEM